MAMRLVSEKEGSRKYFRAKSGSLVDWNTIHLSILSHIPVPVAHSLYVIKKTQEPT